MTGIVPAVMPSSSDDGLIGAMPAGVPILQATAENFSEVLVEQATAPVEGANVIPSSFSLPFSVLLDASTSTENFNSNLNESAEDGYTSQTQLLPPDRAPTEPMEEHEFASDIMPRPIPMPMETEMDSMSVASSSAQILGKRKKVECDGSSRDDEDDLSPQLRRSSRLNKAACIVTDDETRVRKKRGGHGKKTHGTECLTSSKASDTSGLLTQCSEAESGKTSTAKRAVKKIKKRKRSKEPSIIERLHSLPATLDGLRTAPAAQIGSLSQMKNWVGALKEILLILTEKIEDFGDPSYLQRKNVELMAELAASRQETMQLRRDLSDLQQTVQDMKNTMRTRDADQVALKSDKATSLATPLPKRNNRSKERTKAPVNSGSSGNVISAGDVVMRPPLKKISTPIPAVEVDVTKGYKDMESSISKQILDLIAKRKEVREAIKQGGNPPSSLPSTSSTVDKTKKGIRIIENIQLIPPNKKNNNTLINPGPSTSRNDVSGEGTWETVSNKKKKKARQQKQNAPAAAPKPQRKDTAENRAVNKHSGNAALRKLRKEISLPQLEIESSMIKHSANGGVIIEIPGKDRVEKAEKLKSKISEVLKDTAVVTRPVVKGKLRIIGLDDTICREEVADNIAAIGGCTSADVKVGIIRMMSNRMYMVWAQCPLDAAIKAANGGKIKMGWTIAKIELLKNRPAQCYKCWGHGHVRDRCTSAIDRSKTCFR
ncbi:hypothetical protein RF55_6197 [Lasius niger]|uniref:Gag-pol polyprotein n=1 Tax=Lasius niger TaxID=67767 RepID=A0A0J7KTN2_LASNI|nr:hypothetical protein RF55_6197 [Lasius niger]